MANDFQDEDFWDEEEEGYIDESRFPRMWLLAMGILSVLLVVGVVALTFLALFQPIPTSTPALSPGPKPNEGTVEGPVIPPSASVPPQEAVSTPVTVQDTVVSTFPAPTLPVVPAEIAIGIYVQVSGTEGSDLSFRAGPGTTYVRLKIVAEGSVLQVLDGPIEADDYVWWKLQDPSDGVVGWAVADYLKPTAP